jgi:hypothetical protein
VGSGVGCDWDSFAPCLLPCHSSSSFVPSSLSCLLFLRLGLVCFLLPFFCFLPCLSETHCPGSVVAVRVFGSHSQPSMTHRWVAGAMHRLLRLVAPAQFARKSPECTRSPMGLRLLASNRQATGSVEVRTQPPMPIQSWTSERTTSWSVGRSLQHSLACFLLPTGRYATRRSPSLKCCQRPIDRDV